MLDKTLINELQQYVERHLAIKLGRAKLSMSKMKVFEEEVECSYERVISSEMHDFIKNNRELTFTQVLFNFIDERDLNDSDVYKKAGIDRRHFSKIRSNPDYNPGKSTVIALAIALELDQEETDKLLRSAGFSLSNNDTFDLVIKFFLEKKIYDKDNINQALDYFSLKALTGVLE